MTRPRAAVDHLAVLGSNSPAFVAAERGPSELTANNYCARTHLNGLWIGPPSNPHTPSEPDLDVRGLPPSGSGSPASPSAARSASVLGGVLLERFWWGSVFLLAAGPGDGRPARPRPAGPARARRPDAGRLDLISAAMSLVAVLAVVFAEADRPDGIGGLAVSAVLGGLVVGSLRAPPAAPGRPDDRSPPVPGHDLQRLAGHQPGWHLHRGRLLPVRRPISPTGARALATGGGTVVAAVGGRLHRRVEPGSPDPAPGPPGGR